MKRIDKIERSLNDSWVQQTIDQAKKRPGSTAEELAAQTQVSRANCSLELNKLVRLKKAVKIKSFPVRFLPISWVREKFGISDLAYYEFTDLQQLESSLTAKAAAGVPANVSAQKIAIDLHGDPFAQVIGAQGSLKNAISQAKAAASYPPHGLHMLLVGQTGSGKTFFARKIYDFAKARGLLSADAPMMAFNCADYYNNPQLLMSQLFGYVKGAYTGADKDTPGLVEQADHGILLLDEIHRLPPEGQEMLFYFIDNGHFSRLGESSKDRTANVLIIGATTEDPASALLSTFLRRIPMTIRIPSLAERTLSEKVSLAKYLFQQEAQRIKKQLVVAIDVLTALITVNNYGNVGQLKSQIQLVCAQAFLNSLNTTDRVLVKVNDLPEEIRQEWLSSSSNLKKSKELLSLVDTNTVFNVDGSADQPENSEGNIYSEIENKVGLLKSHGVSDDEIHQYIMTDLHLHIKNFFDQGRVEQNLAKFVSPELLDFTHELKKLAEEKLHTQLDQRFIYYMGMHIDAFFKRGLKTDLLLEPEIQEIKKSHAKEYQVAKLFAMRIKSSFDVYLPDIEVIYLTMLLASIETLSVDHKVGVLVVSHGNSTASSMVQVANELFGGHYAQALDMPLNLSPEDIFRKMTAIVPRLDQGKGVLLLVDMGSLAMLEQRLTAETGVAIKTIANVTTSIVLDVIRKVNYLNMDLGSIYNSVREDFRELVMQGDLPNETAAQKVILAICTTGSGTAKKIQDILEQIIHSNTKEAISVKTVSALKMTEQIAKIVLDYQVIAAVGTKRPSLPVPYVSLEELIGGNGEDVLKAVLRHEPTLPQQQPSSDKTIVAYDLCEDILKAHLVYLNPYLINQLLNNWIDQVQQRLNHRFSNSLIIKSIVHTAFAFERSLRQDNLTFTEPTTPALARAEKFISQSLTYYEKELAVTLPLDEKKYIASIFLDEGESVSKLF
ncbi:MAG: sigma 54-interacting transcriptional regulator [Oenococcus sp.]|uniref:sigma-54-dependent transcriptional regulator n=1 Tax=Oenococcus TaxID=46254 RepID=UPI0021E882A8|nr:sigma-54-dependent transcriptional regulator [Oenococcus kitaharae]MCV3296837.1 sigma 54-interacting transcriptional regulator [Oenococcus kitaharae]